MSLDSNKLQQKIESLLDDSGDFNTDSVEFGRTKVFLEALSTAIVDHIQNYGETTKNSSHSHRLK